MIDRFKELLRIKNLTSAQFADRIGVQRSSVSHVLSGRNKPSLEFIMKTLKRYSDLNTQWLLFGEGAMYGEEAKGQSDLSLFSGSSAKERPQGAKDAKKPSETLKTAPGAKESTQMNKKNLVDDLTLKDSQVEKIIILYKDRTFKAFYPA